MKRGEKYEDESIHLLKQILCFIMKWKKSFLLFFYLKQVSGVASLLHDTYNGSSIIRSFMIFI